MELLADTLVTARRCLNDVPQDHGVSLFAALTDAASQVGVLQVMCCTETRVPLYHRLLDQLTAVQLTVVKLAATRGAGTG